MAGRKSKKQLYMDNEPPHFMNLRYRDGDNRHAYPSMSIDEFSDTVLDGLSKSIIAKLEANDYDPKNPPCKASTLRLYHDKCGCSFDYLMCETDYQSPTLKEIGKDPVLSQLDESFWDNLKRFLSDGHGHEAVMLNLLFSQPELLQSVCESIFMSLLRIDKAKKIYKSKELKESLEYQIATEEFNLNRSINRYLEDSIMPLLDSEFYVYENQTKPNLDKATDELFGKFADFCRNTKETTD